MGSIFKEFGHFSAAHQLPYHDGKCCALHGHNYRVEVEVSGLVNEDNRAAKQGMIVDFSVLSSIYKVKIDAICDHALLVGTIPLPWMNNVLPVLKDRNSLTQADALMLQDMGYRKVAFLPIPVTTAEYMAQWMLGQFYDGLKAITGASGVSVASLRLWETPTSYAEAKERYNGESAS